MPFYPGFRRRKAIRYGVTKPGSNLTDFPLLVSIASDLNIGSFLSSRRCVVTLADGITPTSYGNIHFNISGSLADFIFRAKFSPQSAAATNDVLGYLYYDPLGTDQENKAGVLNSNIKGYWPMEEDPSGSAPQVIDWSSSDNDGTSSGSMTSGDLVAGQVKNGIDFDASDDKISMANESNFDFEHNQAWTLQCNYKPVNSGTYADLVVKLDNIAGLARGFALMTYDGLDVAKNNGISAWVIHDAIVGPNVAAVAKAGVSSYGSWHHMVATYNGNGAASGFAMYINGVALTGLSTLSDNLAGLTILNNVPLTIGQRSGNDGGKAGGVIDEVFVSDVVRSADWIAYDHANQFNNSNTVTLGPEELSRDSIYIGL